MKKITSKERNSGMKYCTFCKPEKVRAEYKDFYNSFACKKHTNELYQEIDHITEGDRQSWGKL